MMRLFALLTALWCASFAHAGALWFADDRGIHRIDTDTNAVTLNVSQSDVQALAVDSSDGGLWALSSSRLVKYDANGIKLFSIGSGPSGATGFSGGHDHDHDYHNDNFLDAKRLAIDVSDGSVWAAGRNFAAHVSSTGTIVGLVISFDPVQDIGLASDDSLWVLADDTLARYSSQGTRLASANLSGDMRDSQFLAVDDANGVIWLAGGRKLFKIALAIPIQTRLTRSTTETVRAIALDPATGNLWVAGTSSLFGFSTAGNNFVTTNLSNRHLGTLQALEFATVTQSPWLGADHGLARFTAAGQFATTITGDDVTAIGASASGVVTPPAPTISLVSPANGTLTNNALIPIRIHFDQANTLTATLNGASIAGSFVFEAATGDSVFTPASPYAEGLTTFSAFVTSPAGSNSNTVTTQFTIDTIAPGFVNVTPPDGSSFTSANITLLGSVDEAAGRVLLESFSGATFTGANPQGPSFSWAITLRPGLNSFRLTATDPAGNSRPLSLTYTFSTLAVTITSPANGATIEDSKVTVTGTFAGATTATVTVNGLAAAVTGQSFTAADVPLAPGSNTITVVATSPAGASDTKSITVTSLQPTVTITSPANAAIINGDSVLVRGTFTAPANSGVQVNGKVAAIDGATTFVVVVPLVPGANTLTAKVTSPKGASGSASTNVNASGLPPEIVATVSPLAGMAPLNVTITVTNPTDSDANFVLNTFGQDFPFSVAANGSAVLGPIQYPEGIFPTTVTVDGGPAQSFVIQVTNIHTMDAMIQALWSQITGRLAAGDIEGALVYFSPPMRDTYRQVLNDIAPSLPGLVAGLPPIRGTSLADGNAEYFVPVVRGGRTFGYFIYFMRDGDGIWRLHTLRVTLGFLLALASQAVLAYEEDVHEKMTGNAFTEALHNPNVNNNNNFMFNLGIQESQPIYSGRTALQWALYGCRIEDAFPRPVKHFFDPLNGQGLLGLFQNNPDWAFNVGDTNPTYSIPGTRDSLYKGLTNTDFIVRPKQVRDAFQGVGQFTHLLQDMAQPQHVRNDDHFSLSHAYWAFPSYSRYERRTLDRVETLIYGGYPIVMLPSYRDFWANANDSGLAQQVNLNFVSEGTNLDSGKYGSPLGTLLDEETLAQVTDFDGNVVATNVVVQYVSYSYVDKFAGPITNNRLSAYSIFDFQRFATKGKHAYSLNNENHDKTAELLVPAAVSYSTGLITRFFRGALAVTRPDAGIYGIVDHSTIHQTDPVNGFEGFGTIKVKVRDMTAGSEVVGPGKLVAVAKFHRNGCYKDDLTGEFTSSGSACSNFRTPTEEIVLSNEFPGVTLDKVNATPFTFTFGQKIPINATDLVITVVYRGPIGNDPDELAVGSVDVYEPSYLAMYNSTDRLLFNGTFIDTEATPVPPALDTSPADGALDFVYRATNFNFRIWFTDAFSGAPLATVDALPPKRYIRMAVLTDRRPYPVPSTIVGSAFSSSGVDDFNAEVNQLDWDTRIYNVSRFGKTRGVLQFSVLIAYKFFGSPDFGDLDTLPDLTDKSPFALTTLTFAP